MQDQYPEIYIQFLTSILLAVILIGTTVLIILLYQKRKISQKKAVQDLKSQFEKELIQTQLDIQEQLLTDVSMELHDNIGQVMLLAKVNLTLLEKQLKDAELSNLAADTKSQITKALNDITELSRSMHSDRVQNIGIFTLLHNDFESLSKKGLFKFNYSSEIDEAIEYSISRDKQLTIYRTMQEVVKNIIKHAEATEVDLVIKNVEHCISITITDNGKGINPGFKNNDTMQPANNGIGITSMKKRVEWIKGSFEIGNHEPAGTKVTLLIPIEETSSLL